MTLAVEVLWTRLFAQVLQNSVYTYAIVLVAFLLALSLGSVASHGLARIPRFNPRHVLLALLTIAATVVVVSPWAFHSATAGLTYVGSGAGWMEYLTAVSGIALLVMVLPGVMLGAVLPYLLRVVQAANPQPGPAIGGLVAANTSGAILGSLVAGFRWPAARLRGVSHPGLPAYTQGHLCPCTAASRGTETADRRHRTGLGASLPWAAPMAGECKGCSLDPR
ncbi:MULTISPECIES: hypothetical protein [Halorhodospira]|uniref:hypothetical protein n=1 Tax=Halorhodospira TaxID=85108 RepID=UPI001EE84786|nr:MULTISPECIES: hypothetical protein [Halorhodospira]MCG5528708.1 hypothetical protein [Halorhodospira halophila]MCG5544035.1 hypothetical protein [Halorhodospira sp. 9628]